MTIVVGGTLLVALLAWLLWPAKKTMRDIQNVEEEEDVAEDTEDDTPKFTQTPRIYVCARTPDDAPQFTLEAALIDSLLESGAEIPLLEGEWTTLANLRAALDALPEGSHLLVATEGGIEGSWSAAAKLFRKREGKITIVAADATDTYEEVGDAADEIVESVVERLNAL